ncbi:MAG: translocation/assembly module TamB domain-containing protein [Deltaproteobacteria bacterium]|jgi:translocation and assembly module TamB|nr:translocation/assembly module TamB domain-containing protein [Deltaproteobacteria bacterium]
MKKPKKRWRRVILSLVALLILTIISGAIWLRSKSGASYVFGIIQNALVGQNLTLNAQSFVGPLPFNVLAENISLADPEGQFLTAQSLTAKIAFWPLLTGEIKADLQLAGLKLDRRPNLPAKPTEEKSPSGQFPLGLNVTLALTESQLAGAAINPASPGPPALVNLQSQVFLESGFLAFNAQGSLLDEIGRGLTLKAALGRDGSGPENLELRLALLDQDGQLTGARPDLPRLLKLTLLGQGPLTDWQGQLELKSLDRPIDKALDGAILEELLKANLTPPSASGSNDLGPDALVMGAIKFQGATGQLFEDVALSPNFTLGVDLKTLAKILPPETRPTLPNLPAWPPEAPLALLAEVKAQKHTDAAGQDGHDYKGQLSFKTPLATGETKNFTVNWREESLTAHLPLTLALGSLWALPPTEFDLDLTARINEANIIEPTVNLQGPGFKARVSGEINPEEALKKANPAQPPSLNLAANLELAADSFLYPILRKLVPESPNPGELKVNLRAERDARQILNINGALDLADLGTLYPNVTGPIKAQYSLLGQPANLDFEVKLQSPKLTNPAGPFDDLNLHLKGHLASAAESLAALGQIKAQAKNPVAPLDLAGAWEFSQGQGELAVSLADFHLLAPGLKAQSQELKFKIKPHSPPELAGALTAEALDWPLLGRLVGQDLSGSPAQLAIALKRAPGAKDPNNAGLAEASLTLPDLKMGDFLALKAVNLKLTSQVAEKAQARLDLTQGPGQIGPVAFQGGEIHLTGSGQWSEGLMGEVKAKLSGPKSPLLDLEANYDLKNKKAAIKRLFLAPPQIRGSLTLTKPLNLDLTDGLKLDSLVASLNPSGQIQISGQIGGTAPLKAQVHLQGLPLNILDPKIVDLPAGKVDLKVDYQAGQGGSYDLKTAMTAAPALTVVAKGTLTPSAINGQAELSWPKVSRPVKATFQLPTRPAGQFFTVAQTSPMAIEADWRGPAGQIWTLTGLEDMALKGDVDLKVTASGSLSHPQTALTLYLANGSFQDPSSGLSLSNLGLSGQMDPRGEIKILVEAKDEGQGRLALEGFINPQASPPNLRARAQLDHLNPLRRDDVELTLSALATLEGPFEALKLTARAIVESGEVSLAQGFGGPQVKTLDLGQKQIDKASPLDLDLTIDVPNRFYIRGRGLDSEWQGQLKLSGAASKPVISGYIRPVRGYLELLAKQFTISKGDINFHESTTINPSLNLELTRQTSEVLAIIRLTGSKDSPKINLESQPPRPADEILAQILFGKKTSQLSRVETLQLANNLRSLSGVGPKLDLLTPINAVRDTLGLSVLRLGESSGGANNRILQSNSFRDNLNLDNDEEPAEATSATIEAGKYLTDRVYVGVEQNLAQNSTGVRIEVELTPSLKLETKTTTQSSRVGLGWKKDY